ncbi:MAG: Glutamine-hydrolyzing GMP synthase [Parcubacteria group bacterium GW2011_GWF2_50_9]|nr:MAG: Glutamine-hydrolyzing GMP synthase [Parcubacteria group bacterium GW2011_GWF2_50_9]
MDGQSNGRFVTKEYMTKNVIAVLDFGSQYSHLIVRRIWELGVYAKLLPPETPASALQEYAGVILSGGPQNLSKPGALKADPRIYTLGLPILGVCYGLQLIAHQLGGKVRAGKKREYGPVHTSLATSSALFKNLSRSELTWMSHGDQVVKAPRGFKVIGTSEACGVAAMEHRKHQVYGIQFHPEVRHTKHGMKILENFLKIAKVRRNWSLGRDWINATVAAIRAKVGKSRALLALSGGVDSTVAAYLTHRAIGRNLSCIYVDTGLMRKGETEQIRKTFSKLKNLDFKVVDAEREFLKALKGVTEPEQKRKIVGKLFIRLFEREAKKLGDAAFLVQGTLYTDAITSGVSVGGKAAMIKSHHNVGGLPRNLKFKLIEPLRDLYKDEVRRIGKRLGVPEEILFRQPFPGPGLAVRIIGEVTKGKLAMLCAADAIFREELAASGWARRVQQYFAVLPDIRSVGVQGDARTYGPPIVLRAVTTSDFMTADFARIPLAMLARISARITNEVAGINRVAYDITSKPPGTVEWE